MSRNGWAVKVNWDRARRANRRPDPGTIPVTMPFGEYKGKRIDTLPEDYLNGLLQDATIWAPLRQAVLVALNTRKSRKGG